MMILRWRVIPPHSLEPLSLELQSDRYAKEVEVEAAKVQQILDVTWKDPS